MPSATPLPAGPSHLALFGAEDLLRPDGCPVCGYVADAGDRFLCWFALEAHADTDMITRLCRSLGFCPAHTRGMLGQPGAGGRMTAVYGYLLRAAANCLAEGTSPSAPCLGCTRDADASDRALETLLTGLREADLRDRYGDSHGLCFPHLRAAVPRSGRRLAGWLAADMLARLAAGPPGVAVLGGDRDADADVRARLRASLNAAERGVCAACRASCLLEWHAIGRWAAAAGTAPALCPAHLHDACAGPAAARLLALETERAVAWLASPTPAPGPGGVFGRLASRRHRPQGRAGPDGCPACLAASGQAWPPGGQHAAAVPGQPPVLCLRHVLSMRRRDPRGAVPFVQRAAHRTESMLRELDQASRKQAWAHRDEPRGREMTAWRRAAALVDGRVYGGGPPVPLGFQVSSPKI